MSRGFAQLQDVIAEAEFPELDLALRRGRHVDREDGAWYTLLMDAQEHLEAFYRRYGCELVYKSDGYFYLLPISEQLPRRHLAVTDMLVGQAMALLYLDPASVERGGIVAREQVLEQLVTAMGSDALVRAFLPKRKRYDERVAQKQVRGKLGEAIRRLAALGFADVVEEEQLRLRPALLRFAEPVRGLAEPAEALARLVAQGEVALAEEGESGEGEGESGEGEGESGEGEGEGDGEGGEGEGGGARGGDRGGLEKRRPGRRGRRKEDAAVAKPVAEADSESDPDSESESESESDPDSDSDSESESDSDPDPDPDPDSESESESDPDSRSPGSASGAGAGAESETDEDPDDAAHNRYRDDDDDDDPESET